MFGEMKRTCIFVVGFLFFCVVISADEEVIGDGTSSEETVTYSEEFGLLGEQNGDNSSLQAEPRTPMAIMRERSKQARLVQIKNQILQKLGLPTKPNFTVSGEIPQEEMRRIMTVYYDSDTEEETITRPADNMYAMRFNVYTAMCDPDPQTDREMWNTTNSFKLFFDVRYMPEYDKHVTKAILRLYKYAAPVCHCTGPKRTKIDNDEDDKIRILVYKYLRPLRVNRRVKRKLLLSKTFDRMYEGWISINIRNAVQDWLNPQNRNHGIEIIVENMKGEREDTFTYFDPNNCTYENRDEYNTGSGSIQGITELNNTLPYLEVSSIEVPKDFASRIRDKRGSRSRRMCRRETLYVSFENLGWSDWIIQPQGFETGYCTGSCPRIGWKLDMYKDAWMQRYECCAPSVLKPLKVVHLDQHGKMTFSVFDNFIITDCGCTSGGS